MADAMHLKMHFVGEALPENVDMLFVLLHLADKDFPIKPMRKLEDLIATCDKCKGIIWPRAALTPEEICRAGRQCGLTIKIDSWRKEDDKCKEALRVYCTVPLGSLALEATANG